MQYTFNSLLRETKFMILYVVRALIENVPVG